MSDLSVEDEDESMNRKRIRWAGAVALMIGLLGFLLVPPALVSGRTGHGTVTPEMRGRWQNKEEHVYWAFGLCGLVAGIGLVTFALSYRSGN